MMNAGIDATAMSHRSTQSSHQCHAYRRAHTFEATEHQQVTTYTLHQARGAPPADASEGASSKVKSPHVTTHAVEASVAMMIATRDGSMLMSLSPNGLRCPPLPVEAAVVPHRRSFQMSPEFGVTVIIRFLCCHSALLRQASARRFKV
jgi:hypothetical protein